jgi:hypothetical protein
MAATARLAPVVKVFGGYQEDGMPAEVFVYRGDDAPRRSLPELQRELATAGIPCRIEALEDGPWLVLDGHETDMSITVDADGTATGAVVQCLDSPAVLESLFTAFERIGWVAAADDE